MTTILSFTTLETPRLLLREINQGDLPEIFNIFSDKETLRYYGMEPFETEEEAEQLINAFRKGFEENQAIRWGIILKETNNLIGTIGFHNWSKRSFRAEVGYELSSNTLRKGIMTEALNKVIPYAYNEMGLNRIGATVAPENMASRKLLAKFSFREEGLLQDYGYSNGKFFDLMMHALLKRDWNK
ncbi:GNAT family N-acetyltransferase [Pseudalkalibacillus caeni]|uniref:GNAT family N-acetyltransferase n=1 Tax=Exobacillus caeni TaxID=2574798 RepID=A0A5R9F945_9BACL|nr:GNAT family protein [Pseudalkalibacillus caeni]TLS38138.1 GNAT family N-acetyltransferase [Pseudalkalibacillus caeni]